MIIALGVIAVTTLLIAAIYVGIIGNVQASQHDVDGKRAYAAALAGVNAFTYQLNQNPAYWDSCTNDVASKTTVPGSTTNEQYSWSYVLANGATSCSATDPEASLIDMDTGTLRMEVTGYSGGGTAGNPLVKRTVVTSFGKLTPLDFLWYTVYEALDDTISGYSGCGVFARTKTRSSKCSIEWFSGDQMNGPMYTQDQYVIGSGATPTLGASSSDQIESAAPGTASGDICDIASTSGVISTYNSCGSANIVGTAYPDAPTIGLPSTNTQLYTDATKFGETYTGVTTITLNGNSATVKNCPTSTCTTTTISSLTADPIIYVSNGSGCSDYSYTPFQVTYYTSGCYGDVYVQGNYTEPLTIAAANNIIITGNIYTSTTNGQVTGQPNGTATLGLVANDYIRVEHGVQNRSSTIDECYTQSGSTKTNASNISGEYSDPLTIDAAIMALNNSFMVDNFDCGNPLGTLTVWGAIVQYFRGAVATGSATSDTVDTGYVKDYTYDSRLAALLPPYLFDIDIADWNPTRETLCTPGATDTTGC
jgi:hypothetical protein